MRRWVEEKENLRDDSKRERLIQGGSGELVWGWDAGGFSFRKC